MLGTLRRALDVRGIPANADTMSAEVEGLIEQVGHGIKITTIRVHYRLKIPAGRRTEAERAVAVHEKGCPASQSVRPAITVEWDAEYEEVG